MGNGKRTILLTMSIAVEIHAAAPPDSDAKDAELFSIEARLQQAIEEALGDQSDHLGWMSSRFQELGVTGSNSGRCAVCGAWTTDLEQPDPVNGIQYGARVVGELLCDEHLPAGHPLHF